MLPGMVHAPYGDLEAAREMTGPQTAAVLVEPIQGEGGVNVAPEGFLQGLRELCDELDAVLVFDEVQTGAGRTGHLYAYQGMASFRTFWRARRGSGAVSPSGRCWRRRSSRRSGRATTARPSGATRWRWPR
jgi:hypothetical protein